MAITFAWPLCHKRRDEYATLASAIQVVRGFRQPIASATSPNFIDGLDLWMSADQNMHQLFAVFTGAISFYTASTPQGNVPAIRLALDFDPAIKKGLSSETRVECTPVALHYLNVDQAALRTALEALINAEFAKLPNSQTKPTNLHPILKVGMASVTSPLDPSLWAHLANASAAQRPALIASVLDNFFSQSSSDSDARLPVLAGDSLGSAAAGLPSPPSGLSNPRHLIFKVEERGEHRRNPGYDLWHWSRAVKQKTFSVDALAPERNPAGALHPLLPPIQVNPDDARRPKAREVLQISGENDVYPISILDKLTIFHDPPVIDPKVRPARIHWRLSPDGLLEAKLFADGSTVSLTPNATVADLPRQVWDRPDFAFPIHHFSFYFQVPCEIMIASLLVESGALNGLYTGMERATRLEEYFEPDVKSLKKDGSGNPSYPRDFQLIQSGDTEYSNLVQLYRQTVPEGDPNKHDGGLGGLRTPNPWDDTPLIKNGPMRWGELKRLLQISDYIPQRVSVGLVQTLISSAKGLVSRIAPVYGDIAAANQPLLPQTGDWWTAFGVNQPPTDASEYLTTWLVDPRQSLLMSAAHARVSYNTSNRDTGWDPPKLAACFNSGGVYDSGGLWGMRLVDGYIENFWGKAYNAAVTFFNSNPNVSPAPRVRLKR